MKTIIYIEIEDKTYENLGKFQQAFNQVVEDGYADKIIVHPIDFSRNDCFSFTFINSETDNSVAPQTILHETYSLCKVAFTARILLYSLSDGVDDIVTKFYVAEGTLYYGDHLAYKSLQKSYRDLLEFDFWWAEVLEENHPVYSSEKFLAENNLTLDKMNDFLRSLKALYLNPQI